MNGIKNQIGQETGGVRGFVINSMLRKMRRKSLIYKGKPQLLIFIFLSVFGGIRVIIAKEQTIMNIIIVIAIVTILCIQYQLQIDQERLTYQIFLLSTPIYTKEVIPEQITEIKFIRVDWAKKGAIVRMKKGFNIRVILFHPISVCKHLEQFAYENNVSVNKTRDYKILEKRSKSTIE